MLGWLDQADIGDRASNYALMLDIERTLVQDGLTVSGVIQPHITTTNNCQGDMVLTVIGPNAADIVISQNLGSQSQGCRLDTDAFETVAQLVLNSLPGADLVILNKFGKQEALGRGMVAVIYAAMERDLPIITAVAPEQRTRFLEFSGDLATKLLPADAVEWCRNAVATTQINRR